jgi:hypothetical protein
MRKPKRKPHTTAPSRRRTLIAVGAGVAAIAAAAVSGGALLSGDATADTSHHAVLYKDPQCGCCEEYAAYLRRNGYEVKVVPTHDLSLIKQEHGVSTPLEGCHTTLVEGYVVEGHVPVATLDRLLAEKPPIKGISLPGMPPGSPGMTGAKEGPFIIYAIDESDPGRVYATE